MSKYKTLILVPDLRGGGGVANLYNVLRPDRECDIKYFSVNKPKRQSAMGTIYRLIFNYVAFLYQLVIHNYKLVHVNPSLYPRSFYRDAIFIILSKLLKRHVLVTFHGWLVDYEEQIKKSTVKSFLFKISYAKADKYIVLGNVFKKKLIKMGVPPTTEFFIETTVADTKYVNELNLEKKLHTYINNLIFLFLADVVILKGIYIVLEAYKEFVDKHPERKCCLIVAGDGSELQSVKEYVSGYNIRNVVFTGHITDQEKKEVLLNAHIMLLPSYTEGLPTCILEGMLYGMPIISRQTGAIPDVIQQGINGFLSDSFDADVYKDYMCSLALDLRLYQIIAKGNHEVALQKYATEKVRSRLVKIYSTF